MGAEEEFEMNVVDKPRNRTFQNLVIKIDLEKLDKAIESKPIVIVSVKVTNNLDWQNRNEVNNEPCPHILENSLSNFLCFGCLVTLWIEALVPVRKHVHKQVDEENDVTNKIDDVDPVPIVLDKKAGPNRIVEHNEEKNEEGEDVPVENEIGVQVQAEFLDLGSNCRLLLFTKDLVDDACVSDCRSCA